MNLRKIKSAYWLLAAGFATGAVATISILSSGIVPAAYAGPQGARASAVGNVSETDMATLRSLDASFQGLAEYVAPAVVHIKAEGRPQMDVFGRRMTMGGQGSGVIFRPDGYIVTNDHVVGGFEKVTVVLSDGREFPGKVTRAEDSDIAVVKIDASGLPTAKFGDSNQVRPGQFAIAVGSPFGLENSVTIGHISGLSRESAIPDGLLQSSRVYPDLIQTDASINQGNSGGPLLNINGEIIGINTAIYSETGGSVGIGFAIPSNQARLIAEMLVEKGKVTRGYLGVVPRNLKPYQMKEMNLAGGAILERVENDSPAAIAGLKKDDVVLRIGNLQISNQLDLRNAMLQYEPGSAVKVDYIRSGQRKTTEIKVGKAPAVAKPAPQQSPQDLDGIEGIPPEMRRFFDDVPKNPFDGGTPKSDRTGGKARLGVGVEALTEANRSQFHVPAEVSGAIITSVEPGSVAEKIGLKEGDVVERIGDAKISGPDDVVKAMANVKVGDRRSIQVSRFGTNSRSTQIRDITF
jgi:serine protease Do